jgi:hypothetical protein
METKIEGEASIDDITFYSTKRCRPRILIVTDGGLNVAPEPNGFGLGILIRELATASWPYLPAELTLAHRTSYGLSSFRIVPGGPVVYTKQNFRFDTATPAVTIENYDQVWLFGFSSDPISLTEIEQLTHFMNAGGGVFATGDHSSIGSGMCANLPRVKYMRQWQYSPMGFEGDYRATERFDTIVDPGSDGHYALSDQFDEKAQRIYPNYNTVVRGFSDWTSTIHPLLSNRRTPMMRNSLAGLDHGGAADSTYSRYFSDDIDHMPDHAHESECLAFGGNIGVSLGGVNYYEMGTVNGNAVGTGLGSKIVAWSVAAGRAVSPGKRIAPIKIAWKPPVKPRLFGCISAYDGFLADANMPTNQRPSLSAPGRIVCHSTWHHFIDANLDGTGSGRPGLTRPGPLGTRVPSPELLGILRYFKNIAMWLQPQDRIFCTRLFGLMAGLRQFAATSDEVEGLRTLGTEEARNALGQLVIAELDGSSGDGHAAEIARTVMRHSKDGPGLEKARNQAERAKVVLREDEALSAAFGAAFVTFLDRVPAPWNGKEVADDEQAHKADEAAMRDAFIAAYSQAFRTSLKAHVAEARAVARIMKAVDGPA